jgi:hypothetical protein
LFIVRVAGNVVSPEVMGSLQYAGAHLRTPLFVVLGHAGCGAVKAALEHKLKGVQHRSRVQILVNNILPGLPEFGAQLSEEGKLASAIEAMSAGRCIRSWRPRKRRMPSRLAPNWWERSTTSLRGRSSSLLECGPVTQMKAANAWTVFLRGIEAVMCCLPVELLQHVPSTVTRIYLESMKFRDRLAVLFQPNLDPTGRLATGHAPPCVALARILFVSSLLHCPAHRPLHG